jgi:phosphatidylserine/phosphatidylglycerophosphate/cardiolipin synthase-like enzyme
METYILEEDEVGRRLADALIAKQKAGVQVNLITTGSARSRRRRSSSRG